MPAGLDGGEATRTLWLSALLILPTSLVSGAFFTLLGTALRAEVDGDAAAAGWLTLANTVGAAIGAPLAGLVRCRGWGPRLALRPRGGLRPRGVGPRPWSEGRSGRLVLVGRRPRSRLAAALFPFGLMSTRFVREWWRRRRETARGRSPSARGRPRPRSSCRRTGGGSRSTRRSSRTRTR